MTALKKPGAASATRQCVFILPGVDFAVGEEHSGDLESKLLITQIVSEALAFDPDHWMLVIPERWARSDDVALEHARVRDLARVMAAAADARIPTGFITARDGMKLTQILDPGRIASSSPDPGSLPEALAIYAARDFIAGSCADMPLNMFSFGRGVINDDHGVQIDLTGGARALAWGPHIALPSGSWILQITFELSNVLAGRRLRFEWGHMSEFVSKDFTFAVSGRYQLDLEAAWVKADLSEMRVLLPNGAFSGEFSLVTCRIQRA